MAKKVHQDVLDALLDEIALGDRQIICEGEPADYTAATTLKSSGGNKLGDRTLAAGDFTKAAGDVSGRKITIAEGDVTLDEAGSWDHTAIVDDDTNRLLHVTTTPSTTVSAGSTISVKAYDEEVEDPT